MPTKLWRSLFVLYAVTSGITALVLLFAIKFDSLLMFPVFLVAEFLGAPWSYAFSYLRVSVPTGFESHALIIRTCAFLLLNGWLLWRKGWGVQTEIPQPDTDSAPPAPSATTGIGAHVRRLSVTILIPACILLGAVYALGWGKSGSYGLPRIVYEMILLNCWLFFIARPTLMLSCIVPALLVTVNALIEHSGGIQSKGALYSIALLMDRALDHVLHASLIFGTLGWLAIIIGTYILGYQLVAKSAHVESKA